MEYEEGLNEKRFGIDSDDGREGHWYCRGWFREKNVMLQGKGRVGGMHR